MRLKLPLILALFLCVSGTWARKVVVTSTGDDASNPVEGMLRYHINNAQTGDTIVFNVNQVTLQGEISIKSKTLVIDGEAGVTIDANESGRIFNISSYSRNALLVIKNLKLINGKLSSSLAMGGAMRVHLASGEVLVENCIFESNTVESSGDGQGGALRTNSGTFINCSFINNRVTGSTSILGGGGVTAIGNSRFVNCVVAGNTASYGGASAAAMGWNSLIAPLPSTLHRKPTKGAASVMRAASLPIASYGEILPVDFRTTLSITVAAIPTVPWKQAMLWLPAATLACRTRPLCRTRSPSI